MSDPKRYMITSALPYANGPLHVGHIAGAYLPADIYVRYQKMRGKDVLYICGSDEHGAAITLRAKKEGTTPQDIIDKYHGINKKAFADFGIEFDLYHRTSSELHHETASQFFLDLYNKGVFEEQESEQYFDEEYQQFLADRYIKGTCPNCGYEEAYGDQCENCGTTLSPTELKNPLSTLSGKAPTLKTTKHWYLPLNKYEDWLREYVEDGKLNGEQQHNPAEWKKNVKGQCLSWINGGLLPRAITRDLDWGVKVPLPDSDGKVLYVWLDAPIGYISATKQWAADTGNDWEPYWKDEETKLVHFIGKDNIVFHGIIFPAILKEHGDYILPDNVPANEFMNLEGKKISTSRNWAVWLHEYLEDFPGKRDELRYYLTANSPENKDSEFTWKGFQQANNGDLAGGIGNYVNRVLVLTSKYYEGKVPEAPETPNERDFELIEELKIAKDKIENLLEAYKFKAAQEELLKLVTAGDRHLADTEPWKLIKTDPERVKTILFLNLQVVGALGTLITPFLPDTAAKVRGFLGLEADWDKAGALSIVQPGVEIAKPELLFQKIDDEEIEKQIAKLESTVTAATSFEPVKEEIQFDDFVKLDLRVGTILTAEKVKKANKLLQLTVDMGFEQRTIVSGIAEFFAPEDIIGKQVSVVVNLAPRKLRGILSEGMILMAENAEGQLTFVSPGEQMPAGSVIR